MPLQATSGAASQDAFGGNGVAVVPNYIEDVFSTWLYTGNGSTQTITNGIDLSTKGGLVWIKRRDAAINHALYDTARGANNGWLTSSTTDAAYGGQIGLDAFLTNGFSLGDGGSRVNTSAATYLSWSLRKQPKFFDVVTYTGDGAASRNISHALGSKPGFVVLKRTDNTGNWFVAAWTGTTFRIGTDASPFALNSTNGFNTQNGAAATSTTFDPNEVTLSSNYGVTPSNANINGATYIAYLFAHDAGGFGPNFTDNVISCGSFTNNGSGNATVSLGYEPQWVMIKNTTSAENWYVNDIMRGMPTPAANQYLILNTSGAEATGGAIAPTSTGFAITGLTASATYIYIAIRRGPMKVPTTGTSVFAPYVTTSISLANAGSKGNGVGATAMYDTGFITDFILEKNKSSAADGWYAAARLTGTNYLLTNATDAQATSVGIFWDSNKAAINYDSNYGLYPFKRAPSFMDVVCYTGTGSAGATQTHNLSAVPELMIVKKRSATGFWIVYSQTLGIGNYLLLADTGGANASGLWGGVAPTASIFTLGSNANINESGSTFVWYGFATCVGVSKVGSYTGTGALQTVNCGFTSGARFVLIKRTDSTGDWWTYDSARGISSGNDPYLFLNSTAAEVTSTNYVDTDSTGFKVTAAAPAGLNASGGTYIFLAIA